ncbi:MAG: translation initiation factor [Planctomycetes bacterium]|nr:translation initiation factor [Planctomycetota bacterium]
MTRLFAGTPFDRPPVCERCGKLESECRCPPPPPVKHLVPPEKQTARLAIERRARGKSVTVVKGLAAADNDLPALLKRLKNHCGAGGTLAGDDLEIQGEHLERLRKLLEEIGYRVK